MCGTQIYGFFFILYEDITFNAYLRFDKSVIDNSFHFHLEIKAFLKVIFLQILNFIIKSSHVNIKTVIEVLNF